MASDYEEIGKDNRRRYGEDVGRYGTVLLAGLYNDRKHFIFELLQNAEDAGATHVQFRLGQTSLEVLHDGRPFSSADVRGICGILASESQHDRTRIGRFGIGFKSVYAYTTLPEIHSSGEHFAIRDFVIPFAVEPRTVVDATTRFIFPFNRDAVPARIAHTEIMDGFYDLGPQVLLFLKNIQRISYEVSGGGRGVYRREVERSPDLSIVRLVNDRTLNPQEEQWALFEKQVDAGEKSGDVSIAFQLTRDQATSEIRVTPVPASRLVVYFPTTKETHMGFLMHGPFHTTPTREDIREEEPVNRQLMQEIAELVPHALEKLRDRGILTVGCLQTLPIRPEVIPATSPFRPIYDKVVTALKTLPLLPTADDSFASAASTVLTRSSGLRNLVSPNQLQTLQSATTQIHWLHGDITESRTPDLWRYLRTQLTVPEIDPEAFARMLNRGSLESQNDAWIAQLYRFLNEHPALWQNLPRSSNRRGILVDKPIIRLSDGTHVLPFRSDGEPAAYLDTPDDSDLPTVAPAISDDPDARSFLRQLGIPEPDEISLIIEGILSLYRDDGPLTVTIPQHLQHMRMIARIMDGNTSPSRRGQLREALRRTPFLVGKNAANVSRHEFKRPSELYFSTDELKLYFDGYAAAWFAVSEYSQYHGLLSELGVADVVRISRPRRISGDHIIIREESGNYVRGVNGFNSECNIPGLVNAVTNPTRRRSAFIWNSLLVPNRGNIIGNVQRATQRSYANAQTTEEVSSMGRIVRSYAWLPDRFGELRKPSEMSLDDLPPEFTRNESLAASLGMQASSIRALARELGISADVLEYARRNQELIRDLMDDAGTRRSRAGSREADGEDFDFATELVHRFDRSGSVILANEHYPPGPVSDPERRTRRATDALQTAQANARPNRQRFRRVPSRVWDARDSVVRETLRQYYGGNCQVCGEAAFPKANGDPYFEGVYLVSRTRAEWVENPGNVLCLCPECSAKFQHGSVEAPDILSQIRLHRLSHDGGGSQPELLMRLCGHDVRIRYVEQHFIDLKVLLGIAQNHTSR